MSGYEIGSLTVIIHAILPFYACMVPWYMSKSLPQNVLRARGSIELDNGDDGTLRYMDTWMLWEGDKVLSISFNNNQ